MDDAQFRRVSSTRIYREIANAIDDHRHTCGEHLGGEELLMLDAMVAFYHGHAAQEVPVIRFVNWFSLVADGFFSECRFLPEKSVIGGRGDYDGEDDESVSVSSSSSSSR